MAETLDRAAAASAFEAAPYRLDRFARRRRHQRLSRRDSEGAGKAERHVQRIWVLVGSLVPMVVDLTRWRSRGTRWLKVQLARRHPPQ